jgi:hypothetical protein
MGRAIDTLELAAPPTSKPTPEIPRAAEVIETPDLR